MLLPTKGYTPLPVAGCVGGNYLLARQLPRVHPPSQLGFLQEPNINVHRPQRPASGL